jgi:V-type H+-transporting ATPase subunit C
LRCSTDVHMQVDDAAAVQCREYVPEEEPEEGQEAKASAQDKLSELSRSLDAKKGEVAAWCRTSYGEALSAWVHICAVRLFVESVLRYGLPPNFLGAIIEPHGRTEAKLRKALTSEFGSHGAEFWKADENAPGGSDGKDVHPYVSFALDIDV